GESDSAPPSAGGPRTSASAPLALPAGITADMVDAGQQVFTGAGICFSCHGSSGQGTPLAPSLADGEWIWIEGPEQDLHSKLVALIKTGVPQPRDHSGPMPPMGGASLSDEQVESVAAYVLSLS